MYYISHWKRKEKKQTKKKPFKCYKVCWKEFINSVCLPARNCHSPCNKTEQWWIKRNSNFHSTEVTAIKDLIPCLESRTESTWNRSEGKTEQYNLWTQNVVKSFNKNGLTIKQELCTKLGWAYTDPLTLEAHRKEYVSVLKKPGSQNGHKFHICCSLKWVSAAKKERKRERQRSHAKHSPSISSIRSDPRRTIQKFKEEDGEMRELRKIWKTLQWRLINLKNSEAMSATCVGALNIGLKV